MLIRISLIVAIIAGLAVGALNFTKIKGTITDLRTNLHTQTTRADTAEHNFAKSQGDLKKATNELAQVKTYLATTKKDLATSVAANDTLKKQISTLTENLAKSDKDLQDATILLQQYQAAFPTPQQALSVAKDMKSLQERVGAIEDEK